MGLLQWVAGGILAKTAHNKLNAPQVTVPSGIQMVSCKARGMNEYTIKHKPVGNSTISQFTISRNVRSMSGGWEFYWD